MRDNGAITAIATRYRACGCWSAAADWAKREFRDCSPQTIKACVERARRAVDLADRINAGLPDQQFDANKEARSQA